jgi:uncharacterized membrane protein
LIRYYVMAGIGIVLVLNALLFFPGSPLSFMAILGGVMLYFAAYELARRDRPTSRGRKED